MTEYAGREKEIEAREKAATPEPWRAGYQDGSDPTTVMTVATRQKTSKVGIRVESGKTRGGKFVSLTRDETAKPLNFGQMPDIICNMVDEDLPEAEQAADAVFIAHAREDIPYLLAQLREARAKLAAAEKLRNTGERVWEVMLLAGYLEGEDSDYGEPALSERKALQAWRTALDVLKGMK